MLLGILSKKVKEFISEPVINWAYAKLSASSIGRHRYKYLMLKYKRTVLFWALLYTSDLILCIKSNFFIT